MSRCEYHDASANLGGVGMFARGEPLFGTGVDANRTAAGTILTLDLPSPILFKLIEKSFVELPREEGLPCERVRPCENILTAAEHHRRGLAIALSGAPRFHRFWDGQE